MTLPAGAILPVPQVAVEVLDADPTGTATAGRAGTLGYYGGSIYYHLTSSTDTAWLLLGGVGAAVATLVGAGSLVQPGPSGTPPTGMRAFEVVADETDPNDPDIVRPEGSLLVTEDGLSAWVRAMGEWRSVGEFGALMARYVTLMGLSTTNTAAALAAIAADQEAARVLRVRECRLTYAQLVGDGGASDTHSIDVKDVAANMVLPVGAVAVAVKAWVSVPFVVGGAAPAEFALHVGCDGGASFLISALDLKESGPPGLDHGTGADIADLAGDITALIYIDAVRTLSEVTAGEVALQVFYR